MITREVFIWLSIRQIKIGSVVLILETIFDLIYYEYHGICAFLQTMIIMVFRGESMLCILYFSIGAKSIYIFLIICKTFTLFENEIFDKNFVPFLLVEDINFQRLLSPKENSRISFPTLRNFHILQTPVFVVLPSWNSWNVITCQQPYRISTLLSHTLWNFAILNLLPPWNSRNLRFIMTPEVLLSSNIFLENPKSSNSEFWQNKVTITVHVFPCLFT